MKKIISILVLTIITCNNTTFTMEKEQKPHIVVIPGYYECNDQSRNADLRYIGNIVPYFANNKTSMHHMGIPEELSDFGQNKCQEYLKKKITWCKDNDTLHDNDPLIIYGSFQGSATAINYTAKHPENIKALILESIILTGNSFIEHTLVGNTNPPLSDDPISHAFGCCCRFTSAGYYLLPQIVRMQFWHYCPAGEQPIKNINDLPHDLPIIIVHNTQQISFEDAQALYAFLTIKKNNRNVYLFAQENTWKDHHFHLLGKENTKEKTAISTILKLHNLLPVDFQENCLTLEELKEYQPIPQPEWLDRFNALVKKERNMPYVDHSLKAIIACAGIYALGKYMGIM